MMRSAWILIALGLVGCPYLGEEGYTDKVRDADGDGVLAERFGGRDCDDGNPKIGDCDLDLDGYRSVESGGNDCDDNTASVHPGAPEVCNGVDDDCNALIDNDDEVAIGPVVLEDSDGDGWGGTTELTWCGAPPEGYVARTRSGDCDDSNDEIAPDADERCDDVDHNCDGDPRAGAEDGTFWYADDDLDGAGAGPALAQGCDRPSGNVADNDGDCRPYDPAIHPAATDVPYDGIDNDCEDGDLVDVDGDGESALVVGGSDCDDNNTLVNSQQIESCDGIDNDCDGAIDEGLVLAWYLDVDLDGAGDPTDAPVFACETSQPVGRVPNSDDCDDTNTAVNPSATEECDGIDNDCDGDIDGATATGAVVRYADADLDLFGDPAIRINACPDALPSSVSWVDNDQDCNDEKATANPNGQETCDGIDNDCNGAIDDGASDAVLFYVDVDGDGYGDRLSPQLACVASEGLSRLSSDCDDSDPNTYPEAPEVCYDATRQDCSLAPADDCDGDGTTDSLDCQPENPFVHPSAREICDGIDNDCDTLFDDNDPTVDLLTVADWYADQDGDGFAFGVLVGAATCTPPAGTSKILGDCDDADATRFPGAPEICDGRDNDCDLSIDEQAIDAPSWYVDGDADGFGSATASPIATQCQAPTPGSVANRTDCNDRSATVSPTADEICDGLDNNCDGAVDDADPLAVLTIWYLDDDGDGHGDPTEPIESCDQPVGYVPDAGDCDDSSPDRSPSAVEVCDGIDNDCDNLVDGDDPSQAEPNLWFRDNDLDGFGDPADSIEDCLRPNGYVANADDCDDNNILVRPTAVEVCDGIDNDCDFDIDGSDSVDARMWFADNDSDGWGLINDLVRACEAPPDRVALSGDCDDTDPTIRPGAIEVCDGGIDNNCNGVADDDDPDLSEVIWYPDADADGAGDANATATYSGCTPPPPDPFAITVPGWSTTADDCDDDDAAIGPHAIEVCDGDIDNDCDGLSDNDDPSLLASAYYWDADEDGAGVGLGQARCHADANWAAAPGDCDDTDATRSPLSIEACDGIDNDCNGLVDDGAGTAQWVRDADLDGAYDLDRIIMGCTPPGIEWAAYDVAMISDCNDGDPEVYTGADEICDGKRNDCTANAPDVGVGITWFTDADGDGFGDETGPTLTQCAQPMGFVANDDDCHDAAIPGFPSVNPAHVHPGVFVEFCNGVDDDCDSLIDNGNLIDGTDYYADLDGDGFGDDSVASVMFCAAPPVDAQLTDQSGDCNDSDPLIHPASRESCTTAYDDNCNGLVNDNDPGIEDGAKDWFFDGDNDSYGRSNGRVFACIAPAGFIEDNTDCNDLVAEVHPNATEDCDGLDTDCSNGTPLEELDLDFDGYIECTPYQERGKNFLGGNDCGPTVTSQHPGAPEQCNEVDDDCNNDIDDNIVSNQTYWVDVDNDGYGDAFGATTVNCVQPAGYAPNNLDCDDQSNLIKPFVSEVAGDNVDQNCDNVEDCYTDDDNDGSPIGVVNIGGDNNDADCDDIKEALASELTVPQDCNDSDGLASAVSAWYADCDNDGQHRDSATMACGVAGANLISPCPGGAAPASWSALEGTDCNDNDINATADGNWYPDCDGDTHASATAVSACGIVGANAVYNCLDGQDPNGGWLTTAGTDCNDEDALTFVGAAEVPGDGIDQSCNNREICYLDDDDDGARSTNLKPGQTTVGDLICDGPREGRVTDELDCNDTDPTGRVFESWFVDCDADGVYRDPAAPMVCGVSGATAALSCGNPSANYTTSPDAARDCDDLDPSIHPSATEVVGNNVDEDCSGDVECFWDYDQDGAKDPNVTLTSADLDCLDPGEALSGAPDDCNDSDTNAQTIQTWYADCDLDGFFPDSGANACGLNQAQVFLFCPTQPSPTYTTTPPDDRDCNDNDVAVRPFATELPGDGVDQNCDTQESCFLDNDDDGARSTGVMAALTNPGDLICDGYQQGEASDPIDCNDTVATINPGATEVPGNNVDEDCSNTVDCYRDEDDDDYRTIVAFETSTGDLDCNEPGEALTTALLDCNDADGSATVLEDWYADCDLDSFYGAVPANACGFGDALAQFTVSCINSTFPISQSIPAPADCDDNDITGFALQNWNADQDGDGHFGTTSWMACGFTGANTAAGLSLPSSQWSTSTYPDDCDDFDVNLYEESFWFANQDGDALFGGNIWLACDIAGANAVSGLSLPPAQWTDTAPSYIDCNDTDPLALFPAYYYPDCDGDTHHAQFGTYDQYCGVADAEANGPPMCADTNPPDGGWDTLTGSDCNDEDNTAFMTQDWYPDCDLDGAFDLYSVVANACGIDQANAGLGQCPNFPLPPAAWTTAAPTTANADCDDSNPYRSPFEAEVCDGLDNDCDWVPGPGEADEDYDGWLACGPYIDNGATVNGGDDCLDAMTDPDASQFFPGQTIAIGYLNDSGLQSTIDRLCGDGTILLEAISYGPITLPSTKGVSLVGSPYSYLGSGTSISGYSTLVTANNTPVGTSLSSIAFFSGDSEAIAMSGNAKVEMFGLSFQAYGEGGTAQGITVDDSVGYCDSCDFSMLSADEGAALKLTNSSQFVLSNSNVADCTGYVDAPIYAADSELIVQDTKLEWNYLPNAGQAGTSLTAFDSITTLDRVEVRYGQTNDRQPSVHVSGGAAALTDLKIVDSDGGLWITGGAVVDAMRLSIGRIGGNAEATNYEGAIELRDAASLTLTNSEIYANGGPGVHLRDTSSVDLAYNTIVRNAVGGIVHDTGNANLTVHHTVFHDNSADIVIGSYAPSPLNVSNLFDYGASPGQICSPSYSCSFGFLPDFISYFPTLIPQHVVLRPKSDVGLLWNGALPVTDSLFDPTPIIGSSGGPDGQAVEWHGSFDGDTLPDGWEIQWTGGTTDLSDTSHNDGDTWNALTELNNGTSPILEDTDGDGYFDSDSFEYAPLDCSVPYPYGCP